MSAEERIPPAPPPADPITVGVVIVNYRTAGLAIDCLRSLEPELESVAGGARVIITDNLSGDGSAEMIAAAVRDNGWSHWAVVDPLPKNGGFAYGNNAAIRPLLQGPAKPRYVLLLNPDTVVRAGAVRELVSFMDEHPKAGIAGSRLEDPDGTPQISAFRFPTALSELDSGLRLGPVSRLLRRYAVAPPVPEAPCPTDWVAGASMIVRREVLESVGLLDEGYFMYYEEVDFCLRARRAGWPCWYVPASRVVHLVGAASGVSETRKKRKRLPAYWFESRRRFFLRNYNWPHAAVADALFAAGFAVWRVRRAIQRKPDNDPPNMLGDFLRHSVLLLNGTRA